MLGWWFVEVLVGEAVDEDLLDEDFEQPKSGGLYIISEGISVPH